MRLLKNSEDGGVTITRFNDNEIPPYAILSHTWATDTEDEVTFDDLVKGGGQTKRGYQKIRFCGEQASRDGLKFFWVDTCCIDKTNEAEVSNAINSMFRWYRNSARCYVYLSDISSRSSDTNPECGLWEQESDGHSSQAYGFKLQKSRWFTRGWTLQELLAPSCVEFFSRECERLGDTQSLMQHVHETTGIPERALAGVPLSQFSDKERFLWSQCRKTKVEEDKAYSLLGIFGVEMPLRYGEGSFNAFKRLEAEVSKLNNCLRDLRPSDPRDDKRRIEETKGGLLVDSYRWILDSTAFQQWRTDSHNRLLWVKGDPGKGKTMLLCGIINELQSSMPKTDLLSYFFCQQSDSRINSATAVLQGLLYMLIDQQPSLVSHVSKKHDHAGKSMFQDVNAWVVLTEIFMDVLQDPRLSTTYLVIDALDECITGLAKLLEFVAKQSSNSSRVKWIVSSRNWPDIEARLEQAEHKVILSIELNAGSVAEAVNAFIHQKVEQLAQEKQYRAEVRHAVLQHLTLNAHDTFLWVALVCQDLKMTHKFNVLKKIKLFPPGLDAFYKRMLDQISESDIADICQQVLASTAVLYRPVTIPELIALVQPLEDLVDDLGSVREIIGLCGSFLTLRDDTVYFIHQSAKDFLFAKALEQIFPHGTEAAHQSILSSSLAILSRTLGRDIYGLEKPGIHIDDVETPDLDPLSTSRYACIYWIDHLYNSKPGSPTTSVNDLQVLGMVDGFLREKYLYWLEGLSLCKSLGKGVLSMTKLLSLVQRIRNQAELTDLVRDARRFIMYHKGAIESYPLQSYASALLFSPTRSIIRQLFQHEEPKNISIRPAMSHGWSACLQTLEGHEGAVNSVAFSHDSTRLASASYDGTVKIWDASGGCLQTLKGHVDCVHSVVFSHGSTQLASASKDGTVKIWDASGECLRTLKGHFDSVNSVVFSHSSAQLASASCDKTIKIWDASGACVRTLVGHRSAVTSVAFSHNSTLLASASEDKTIKIWDASGACVRTLEGHSDAVNSVAFSHGSAQLASVSNDGTVRIWDTSSGACHQTINYDDSDNHDHAMPSVSFSHDSSQLATAINAATFVTWSWETRDPCTQTFSGDLDDSLTSVAFSQIPIKLLSAAVASTIKIWDTSSGACLQILTDHGMRTNSVAFSHDSSRLASGSDDWTIRIWDVSNGECLQTLDSQKAPIISLLFSHDLAQLASASLDGTVKIWNTSSGACVKTLKAETDGAVFSTIVFSHDSALLASASCENGLIKIWVVSSGECLRTLKSHNNQIRSVAFSHDSAQLASSSADGIIKIWNTSSGACVKTLKAETDSEVYFSIVFSHDSALLASALSKNDLIRIWIVSSGECIQTLRGHDHTDVQHVVNFVHDSTQLASMPTDGPIKIWDINSGKHLRTLRIQVGFGELMDPFNLIRSLDFDHLPDEPEELVYQNLGLRFFLNGISYGSQDLLWLPREYRPSHISLSSGYVGMSTPTHKVWICQFR